MTGMIVLDKCDTDLLEMQEHPKVIAEADMAKKIGVSLLDVDFACKQGEYMLACYFSLDLYMARLADGAWVRCYRGMDDEYNRDVLERKYGLSHVFTIDYLIDEDEPDVKIYV